MIPANHMSMKPGTAYGELFCPDSYNPDLLSNDFWASLSKKHTKVDIQFADRFDGEVQNLLRIIGVTLPVGYRPLDVRHTGKEFSIKAYTSMRENSLTDSLLENVPTNMGRWPSNGVYLHESRTVTIASVWVAICALKKGFALHARTKPSRYQKAEEAMAHALNHSMFPDAQWWGGGLPIKSKKKN